MDFTNKKLLKSTSKTVNTHGNDYDNENNNENQVMQKKQIYFMEQINKDYSSTSESSESNDSFSQASKLLIYKETMQGPEVNPKFLNKIVNGNPW